MLDKIYKMCGINYSKIPDSKQIDCNKKIINRQKEEEIIKSLEEEYLKLNELKILLVLLNYGPMVDENQTEEVVIKKDYIIEES
mgnify:CR=1 FL=1